jgi:glutamate synthase domain-containing protein 2/glutamate synthase domain-containing protein 1/glutamate synthase domain-containing protein 3
MNFNSKGASGERCTEGLYDPVNEKDSCGVGMVVRIDGSSDHAVVSDGLQILINLEHRGAVAGDQSTGDGAGILVRIPDQFFRNALKNKVALPAIGSYGIAMCFLPTDKKRIDECCRVIEKSVRDEGCEVLIWRDVPVKPDGLGEFASSTRPAVRQCIIGRNSVPSEQFELKLYCMRRTAEKAVAALSGDYSQFYICSASSRTVVYKGLFTGAQLRNFYSDLTDTTFTSPYSIVHQRYSTNTMPTWALAHPFRYLAHNGEINTLRGNINRMKARESLLASTLFGEDIKKITPVIVESGSDSAILDNVLELLTLSGRSLPHAIMMMIPEAWGDKYHMSADKRAFYEYHSSIMEPWDGPAAVAFTDDRHVGALLDRNGLRPARFVVTRDGRIILGSESGVLDIAPNNVLRRGRLQPGRMLLVDLIEKRIVPDNEMKSRIARRKPYRHWVKDNKIELRGFLTPADIPFEDPDALLLKQIVFGYTEDELRMVLAPMAENGQEAVGSMGDDTPLAVLSNRPKSFFVYFKQLFAQVTNPPIDPLREELVMSLMTYMGPEQNLLEETPEHCRRLKLPHPILTPDDLVRLRNACMPEVNISDIDILFPVDGDGAALEKALESVFREAEDQIAKGATFLVLTDRRMDKQYVPIPVLLALSGLHHHLIRNGLRTSVGLIVETGEAREIMHIASLLGYGANAVCPHIGFSTLRDMVESGFFDGPVTAEIATDNYIAAIKKGLLKTMSRMGISTLRSYSGAQIFEIVGFKKEVVDKYFTGTPSRVEGIDLSGIALEANMRHARAYRLPDGVAPSLAYDGLYNVRKGGEKHLWSPEVIYKLQQAVRNNDYKVFKEYSALINDQSKERVTLRSLLKFKKGKPIDISEVEPVSEIVKRFVSSAMSFGSISQETHETIAEAMNKLGGKSNSGEGGEAPERYTLQSDGRNLCSKVKQVASGRFGVSTEYLTSADELQIKMAQGAKPGEGGQLPGHKVSAEIGRVRYTTPGVTLISPPPHHDIYSIEDIAQLIHDLKCVNPKAAVSVKLVSEVGVGTVAAGVAKAKADMVLISGCDGGTGASPLTSIKYAGLPWELGLAEAHQTLVVNRLRDRIRIQTDGQLRTGRDIAIAAMLGAEEFGFGTVSLVTLGCVMLRKCHLNTCAMGVATQDPALRERFKGKPEHLVNFMLFIAQDLREVMAALGVRTVKELVGRTDLLEMESDVTHFKAKGVDLSLLLHQPVSPSNGLLCNTLKQDHELNKSMDNELIKMCDAAINEKKSIVIDKNIRNVNRTVGAMLSGEIVRRLGQKGLPDKTIQLNFKGSAGQSLGAFLAPGIEIRIEGDTNDYLGKGMSGGRIIITPPKGSLFLSFENVIAGNTALYGATGGEVFLSGMAGERFAVRNSGAVAVVEGVGDHGCEYMTGGTIVVLGGTGVNFAAGMSGGIAYVYDPSQLFDTRCNLDMVDLETVWLEEDKVRLKSLIELHLKHTDSKQATFILEDWESHLPLFVKVIPIDYRKVLERMKASLHRDDETLSSTEEVFRG